MRIIWIGSLILFCLNSGCQNKRPIPVALPWAPTSVSYVCDSNKPEPSYEGVSISQWIKTKTLLNPQGLSLQDLLTLKQLSPPDEWGVINFELPINNDVVNPDGGIFHLGCLNIHGEFVECNLSGYERATNGHCQIWWNINWDPPGKHLVRARLACYNHVDSIVVFGPARPVYTSNACRFFAGTTMFDSTSAFLEAKLRELIASYSIEAKTIEGKHIRTFNGRTTNGIVDMEWNLLDENGKVFSGSQFDGLFRISYPGDRSTNAPAKTRFTRFDR
jgi:hypothetical protein